MDCFDAAALIRIMEREHAGHERKLLPERQGRDASEDEALERRVAFAVCLVEQAHRVLQQTVLELIILCIAAPGQPVGQAIPEATEIKLLRIRSRRSGKVARDASLRTGQTDEIADDVHHRRNDAGEIGNLDEIDDQVLLTIMLAKIGRDIRRCCDQDDGHLLQDRIQVRKQPGMQRRVETGPAQAADLPAKLMHDIVTPRIDGVRVAEDPGIRVSVYGFILQIALDEMCVNVHGITFGSIITVRGENEKHTAEAVRSRDRKVSIAKDSMKGGIIPAAFRIVQAVILFKTTGKNWLK